MYLFLIALPLVLAIDSPEQFVKIFLNKVNDPRSLKIMENQTKRIIDFPNSNDTISMKIEGNTSLCKFHEKTLLINNNPSAHFTLVEKSYLSSNLNHPQFYEKYPKLGQMVETYHGNFVAQSDFKLLHINLNYTNDKFTLQNSTIDYKNLMKESKLFSLPQLLFDRQNSIILLIYPHQLLYSIVKSPTLELQTNNQFNYNFTGTCRVNKGFLFVPLGSLGLDVYQILHNGTLKYILSYKTMDCMIVDVSFSEINFPFRIQLLLILDKFAGVIIQSINYDQFQLKTVYSKIDLIGGYLISSYKQIVMVLAENLSQNYVLEFTLYQDKVFLMKNHSLESKYFEIDISDKFAIIKGIDAHLVIFHSLYSQFDMTHDNKVTEEQWYNEQEIEEQTQKYLFLPQLQSLQIHTNKIWRLNNNILQETTTKYPYFIGVTSFSFVIIEYQLENPYVECQLHKIKQQSISLSTTYNSTECNQKTEFIHQQQGPMYENLMMCTNFEDWTIEIEESYNDMKTDFQIYYGLVIILFFGTCFVALFMFKCYQRQKLKKDQIIQNIQILEKQEYTKDSI